MSRAPRMTESEYLRRQAGARASHERRRRAVTLPYIATGRPAATPQTLWIPGAMPALNEIIDTAKAHWSRYRAMKEQWDRNVAVFAGECALRPVRAARFEFTWIAQSRRLDPDNIAAARKFIFDGLVACKVLPGDGWKVTSGGWTDAFDVSADAPGTRVVIIPTTMEA